MKLGGLYAHSPPVEYAVRGVGQEIPARQILALEAKEDRKD
jgi:hypothetical protein